MEGKQCPKCKNGQLKQRNGKFGDFYGCTKYPECTYTFTPKVGGYPEPSPNAPQASPSNAKEKDGSLIVFEELQAFEERLMNYLKSKLS